MECPVCKRMTTIMALCEGGVILFCQHRINYKGEQLEETQGCSKDDEAIYGQTDTSNT